MPATFSIATWNVNSIRARMVHLLNYLDSPHAPDILLLQELKVEDGQFPAMEIEERGYNLAVHGQKSYNGVAILSKFPLEDVVCGLPEEGHEGQSRYIEALANVQGKVVRVASIYLPNGSEVGSDKFAYKMRFLTCLRKHAQNLLAQDEPLILGGDYNVAPLPIDVYDPKSLDGTVCYHPDERAHLRAMLNMGLYDAYRAEHPHKQQFSWWDYRGSGWEANKGMRIDHLLLNASALDSMNSCEILADMRAAEKASDHVPVVGRFTLA